MANRKVCPTCGRKHKKGTGHFSSRTAVVRDDQGSDAIWKRAAGLARNAAKKGLPWGNSHN